METKKIYQEDRNLYNLQTEIIDARPVSGSDDALLVLSETIFFPGGGGQSCDLGTIKLLSAATDSAGADTSIYEVIEVFEKDNEILHRVKGGAPLVEMVNGAAGTHGSDAEPANSTSGNNPSNGIGCEIEIDWDRRFDNMQRHCGEHILSGVFYDLYGGVNRGFHMGDDYLTIDISLEDKPEYVGKEITWDMAMAAELRTNEIIWKDLPVVPHHFDSREEAEKMPVRKALAIDDDITIVTIGDPTHPADSVACCGTHPTTTGQVGLLKIFKVEPNKGMYRIFFDAGKRALNDYGKRFDTLGKFEKDLSAGLPDIMEKYAAKQEKQREVRDRLYHLTKAVIASEQERILSELNEKTVYKYSILSLDDLIELGRGLTGKLDSVDILFLLHEPSLTLLLFSDKNDCGKLVKENASVFNGKGGGNQNFARAIFGREDDANMFIDAVGKLLM